MFSTLLENFLPFSSDLKLSSANTFSSEESKTCRLGKGYIGVAIAPTCIHAFTSNDGFIFCMTKKIRQEGHDGPGVAHLSLPDCDSKI